MKWIIGFTLCLALNAAGAQQVTISTVPGQVAPDAAFFVELTGTFSSPCVLAGDSLTATVDSAAAVLTIDLTQRADISCVAAVVNDRQAFGPFRIQEFASGQLLDLVFRAGLAGAEPEEIARGTLTLAQSAAASPLLQPGVYWDPDFPGHGVAVERQGQQLFAVLFSFADSGADAWLTLQSDAASAGIETSLNRFAGGGCLLCGDRVVLDSAMLAEQYPVLLQASASQGAMLALTAAPARALILQPFSQRLTQSEGTIAGVTFNLPDFTGRWLFADVALDGGEPVLHQVVTLAQVFSGISDSGMAVFASAGDEVRVTCGKEAIEQIRCHLIVEELEVASANLQSLSHNRLDFGSILGVRLD